MTLVDEDDGIVREVLHESRGRLAGRAARQEPGVVLDTGTHACGSHHLEIEGAALLQPFGFQETAPVAEVLKPFGKFHAYRLDRLMQCRLGHDVVAVGVDDDLLHLAGALTGEGIELLDGLDFVAEHGDAPRAVLEMTGKDLERIAPDPEGAALECSVVAAVLQFDKAAHDALALDLHARPEGHRHGRIALGVADAVYTRDAGDDDRVGTLKDCAGRRVPHAVDLLVPARLLLDVGVGPRNIGFRLVVVVVGDKILDGVVGKEAPELTRRKGRLAA